MVAASRPFFPMMSQSRRESILELEITQQETKVLWLGMKIAKVKEIHRPIEMSTFNGTTHCAECQTTYPCTTVLLMEAE